MERLSYDLATALQQEKTIRLTVIAHNGRRSTSPLHIIVGFLRALTKISKTDVVILGDPMLSLTGALLKLIWHKPVAVNVHGLDIIYPNIFYQAYLKLFFMHFDTYLPISSHVNTLLERHRVSGKRTVVNPGVHDTYYDPSIQRSELSKIVPVLTGNERALLTVGRLIKRKGHAWFVTNVLPHLTPDTHYVIAGTGPEHQAIKAAAVESGTIDRVHFLGRVSTEQLKVLYNTVDAFIQPNIPQPNDVEGFGLVLLEAALCDIPVFAADLEGMTDAVTPRENGYLLEPENSSTWISALNQPLKPIAGQREFSLKHFNWDAIRSKYISAII